MFLLSADFFWKSTFSKYSFTNTLRVSNSLNPVQAPHFVGPDLGPNYLQRLSIDDNSRQRVKFISYYVRSYIYIVYNYLSSFFWCNRQYLHFRSNHLMNLKIFETVHSLMNYTHLINSCQAHLPVQYASKVICQKWYWCCDWQRATPESHMQNKPLICSIGCPCSSWLFRFSTLHSD